MTNLDAIRALCTKICSGFYPDQNVLEFTLLDNGIDPSKNFIPKDVELVKAAISVVKGMTENSHSESGISAADYGKILSKDMNWTVDAAHMAVTNDAFFMHCLPVRRNMIVTDEVIEAPTSLVIPEAANREISATVVLKRMLEGLE